MPSFNLPISDLPWDASPAILLVIGSIAGLYTFYYFFLLPTPIPGIPYDHGSAKKVLGDGPSLTSDPEGLAAWSSKHLEKLRSPICQALLGPDFLSKPIVLVADVGEIRDVLLSRSDFDRSSYLIDRFPLFGDFHLNMKTNEEWKLSRNWSKDLLNPQYMNDVASPAIEMAAKRLIKLWETKSRLAEGKPFDMNRDIKGLSIDVIMAFYFGDDVMDSILAREVDLIKGLHSSELTVGKYNTLRFPQAKLHKFLEGLVELSHTITSLYTTSWPPKLAAWWTRYIISSTRKYFSDRERAVRQLISKSVTRIQGTDKDGLRSGLDHMVWREDKAASKALRKPVYNKQIMVDEVSELELTYQSLSKRPC